MPRNPAWQSGSRVAGTSNAVNIIDFERTLVEWRFQKYHHPEIDIIGKGFRPVSGQVADFGVAEKDGRHHFFYIERRLTEGTPFYPGNEIYFGHASTHNLIEWQVHDPVMLIRPGTWEGAHVWAPCIMRHGDTYVMAYTGINRHISQDIGLAFSDDLFEWRRWEGNPVSPCKDKGWSFWREDCISSCRDPHLFEHDGRFWMAYTANTREGATCIALCSSDDLEHWEDHGPILVGLAEGYEPNLWGGHPQGSLESAHLLTRNGKWYLMANLTMRNESHRFWIFESNRMDHFDLADRRPFWGRGGGMEIVKERGSKSLVACFDGGFIRLGEVDWSAESPNAHYVSSTEQLEEWQQ